MRRDSWPQTVVLTILILQIPILIVGEVNSTSLGNEGDLYVVIQVIDGDTIYLANGESVRYLGINAPETQHPTKGNECYGREATRRNSQLVEGKTVRLEKDITDRDKYGRLLRYVFVNGKFVNAILVEEGFAYSSYYSPDLMYYKYLLELELEAEKDGRGLWLECSQ